MGDSRGGIFRGNERFSEGKLSGKVAGEKLHGLFVLLARGGGIVALVTQVPGHEVHVWILRRGL